MTTIRCTQKLLKELRTQADPEATADDSGWHANLLLFERRKCVLFTYDETLFSFFLCGLTRPDFARFSEVFDQGLFKALLQLDFGQAQVERMLNKTSEIRLAKTNNRGVLGSMNNMKQMLVWSISAADGLENFGQADLTRLLNKTPSKAIGYDYPLERLRRLVSAETT